MKGKYELDHDTLTNLMVMMSCFALGIITGIILAGTV